MAKNSFVWLLAMFAIVDGRALVAASAEDFRLMIECLKRERAER